MVAKTNSTWMKINSEKMNDIFFSSKAKSVMFNDLFFLHDVGVNLDDEFRVESIWIMDSFKNV